MTPTRNTGAPATDPDQLHDQFNEVWGNPRGWRALTIVNHTSIGLRFLVTGAFFFLVGGLLAAVLGVVKTMGSISEPPEVLGGMIGSALVGTFLGVLLAYGIVSPLASRLKQVIDADAAIYGVVKQIIIASLHGHPQPLVIEAARSGIAHKNQPGFAEVFDGLRGK